MKKLLISFLVLLMSQNVMADEMSSAEGRGKVGVQLKYLGFDGEAAFVGGYGLGLFLGLMGAPLGPAGVAAGASIGASVGAAAGKRGTTKTKSVKLKWEIIVQEYAQGKANVVLMGQKAKKCAPFAIKMVAISDATGVFELYADEERLAASESFGEMIVGSNRIHIELNGEQGFVTKGRKGYNCVWTIPEDTAVQFKRTL